MNKTYKYILVLLVSVIVAYYNSGKEEAELSGLMPVSRVVDGDTFWAEDGSKKGVKIRLIGVDAPETRNSNYKKIGFYGQEAKAYLTDLLDNQEVRLEYGVDSLDRYGRVLAYVYLSDGTFVNEELIKNGFARVLSIPPNIKYVDVFASYERDARESNRGLWQKESE
tara:strand:+ start:2446 stop:2946 length:501 start_codon:yes stop_codon:yes gene_type:complete